MREPLGPVRSIHTWPLDRWSLLYGNWVLPAAVGLLPVVAIAVPRGLVLLLVATSLLALPALFRREDPPWLACLRLIAGRDPSLLFWLVLGAAWALIACLWAPTIWGAFALWIRLAAMSLCGLVLLAVTDRLDPPRRERFGSALILGAAVALVLGHVVWLSFWLPAVRQGFKLPYDHLFELNRGVALLAVLAWPALLVLWRRGQLVGAGVLAFAYLHLLVRTESASAKAAAVAAFAALIAVMVLPRIVPLVVAGVLATLTLLLPWAFSQLPPVEELVQSFPQLFPSAQHRLYIWQFAVERIGEHPWLGWGLDASRNLPGGKVRPPVGMEMMPLHPHNNLLQIRLELGLTGAAIMAALLARGWSLAARQPDRAAAAVHAAMLSGYLVVGLFGYGMWQSWWIAAAWLSWAVGPALLPDRPVADAAATGGMPSPRAGRDRRGRMDHSSGQSDRRPDGS